MAEELPWNSDQTKAGKTLIRKMLAGRYDALESLPDEPPVVRRCYTAGASGAQHRRSLPAALPVPQAEGDSDGASAPVVATRQRHSVPSAPSFAPKAEQMFFMAELVKTRDVDAVKQRLAETRARSGKEAVLMEIINCEEGPEDVRIVQSSLHVAAQMGLDEILQALLATRADPNLINDQSNTPLHLASASGRSKAIEVLLDAGADPLIKNSFGKTAEQLAVVRPEEGRELAIRKAEVQKLFRKLGTVSLEGRGGALQGDSDSAKH
jgi:hypothetical protein